MRTIHPLLLAKRYHSLTLRHKLYVLCHKFLKDISSRIGYDNNKRLKVRLHANLLSYGNGATAIGVRSPVYTARKKSAFSRAWRLLLSDNDMTRDSSVAWATGAVQPVLQQRNEGGMAIWYRGKLCQAAQLRRWTQRRKVAALLALLLLKKKKLRRFWAHPILERRKQKGDFFWQA